MKKVLRFRVAASAVLLLCVATAIAASAQTFTTLASFDESDGGGPLAPLVQGFDGNYYGTTNLFGAHGGGTVFEVTARGELTTLYSFCAQPTCTDGDYPSAGLIQATDGNFYGTTEGGGANGYGTVFSMTSNGVLTTLYSFCALTGCSDGGDPFSTLVQAADGNFYGTTSQGGAKGYGTVFKVTSKGVLSTLYSFCAQARCTDGAEPIAGLVQANNGNFYGTTNLGGVYTDGTIFEITPAGTLTTLHSFYKADGFSPTATLTEDAKGNFYSTTLSGGMNGRGTVFRFGSDGTLMSLYSFCAQVNCTDGASPYSRLIQATDGNFYGTTDEGGANNYGTLFKITPEGALTTLHSFDSGDGSDPLGGLAQATNGNFYGTTVAGGGSINAGTVFSLSVGFAPFVETLPAVGKVGSKVIILGNGLTGTSSVTFNGTAATFAVVSPTELKTTVPIGATSGKVQVTTPHGTLTSNVVFRVK